MNSQSKYNESDKQLSSNPLFKMLKKVCVHTAEESIRFTVEDRRNAIRDLCVMTKLKKIVDTDYLLIYSTGKENNPGILFSVHIDTVFNKDQHGVSISADGTIEGTLDNTASIAAIVEAMKNTTFTQHSDIYVSFTGGEEIETMNGARLTAKYFHDLGIKLHYIVVLDITAENFDKDVSVENYIVNQDDFDHSISQFYVSKNISAGFIPAEVALPDETIIYRKTGINSFSLCLPVSSGIESMHEIDCKTTLEKMHSLTKVVTHLPGFLRKKRFS